MTIQSAPVELPLSQDQNNIMTDTTKYRSVALSHNTWSKLDRLSRTIAPGIKLSKAKTVECLVVDRLANPHKQGTKRHG